MIRIAAEYLLKKDIADRNKDTNEQGIGIKAKEEGKGRLGKKIKDGEHEERIR